MNRDRWARHRWAGNRPLPSGPAGPAATLHPRVPMPSHCPPRLARRRLAGLALSFTGLGGLGGLGSTPVAAALPAGAVEPHHRLDTRAPAHAQNIALTLDACGGACDHALIAALVRLQVPATLFVTRRWLSRHAAGLQQLLAHPQLFELENHGAEHRPAVVGHRLYGMDGLPDQAAVAQEVTGGADAVARATGRPSRWYRGAGALYDSASLATVHRLQHRVAGFSLNADAGATLGAALVARRLRQATAGDIVLAHMNHPASGTAAGLAEALPELQRRGLRFVRLSQAAGVFDAPTAR
jgi:peptidoglycan/xylan/chitin deacetylase (PgdA/CDA1 family)